MSPGLIYRAALEGVTLALLAGFRSMQAAGMGEAKDLCLVGGGSNNRLWRQIIADAFQLPVRQVLHTFTLSLYICTSVSTDGFASSRVHVQIEDA